MWGCRGGWRGRPDIGAWAALALAAWLGACGFQPLYGSGGTAEARAPAELARIEIVPIADHIGQQLENDLLDLLTPGGRPADAPYVLRVMLAEVTESLALAKNQFATRANYRLNASYFLVDRESGRTVVSDNKSVVSSYNILSSPFATLMAERDAKARAVREAAEIIRNRLAAHFLYGPSDSTGAGAADDRR